MRHAKAASEGPGESDFERRLTVDGIQSAADTATMILNRGLRIDRVIASSASRTRQTADLIIEGTGFPSARLDLDELYLAPAKTFEAAVCERTFEDESSVMIVGHNPGIAGLICRWADRILPVPTSTVAVFESSADTWQNVRRTKTYIVKLVCLIQDGKVV